MPEIKLRNPVLVDSFDELESSLEAKIVTDKIDTEIKRKNPELFGGTVEDYPTENIDYGEQPGKELITGIIAPEVYDVELNTRSNDREAADNLVAKAESLNLRIKEVEPYKFIITACRAEIIQLFIDLGEEFDETLLDNIQK